MALNDKNIIITPNIGSTSDPKIEFKGADASTGPSTITATVYPTNGGTLSFQATEGTLFSISNSLSSGSIFSVNPISGIPIIDVNANRTIALNPYGGNTGIGTTNPTSKLHVTGDTLVTGISTASRFVSNVATGTAPFTVSSTTSVNNLRSQFVTNGMLDNNDDYMNFRVIRNSNSSSSNDGLFIGYSNTNSGLTRIYGGGSTSVHLAVSASAVTFNSNTVWHAGNDGAGSGLDADLLDGLSTQGSGTAITANQIARSDANGYVFFNYINSNTGNSENPTISQVIVTNGSDNYYRKSSIASFTSAVQSNASGSWGINITGNAATATSADQIDGIAFRNSNSTSAISAPDTLDSNGVGYVTGISLYGQTDGALHAQAYSAAWQHQIYGDYRTGQIAVRGKNNGTWQAWRNVLDSSNYTTYVGNGTLTLGVSGTGLSGSASFTANQSGNTTFTVTSNATSANTASAIVARDASGNFSAGTISAALSASADQAIVNQNNGNAAAWYGRILSKNSTSDKSAFLGTYSSIAGVFAQNNALTTWTDLYVNTVDGSSGGTVRMPSSVLVNGSQVWHAGNDGSGSGLDADLIDGINSTGLFNNMGGVHATRSSFDATTPSYDFGFRYVQGSTNGPGTSGGQFYSWYIGLGSDYAATGAGSYGAMFAVDRNVTNPYLSVRYNEGNTFTAWYKIRAGAADQVVNSVTFNNGGAGAASGTTFNGSAAQTISYNTIGASPLAGSASLTTTGTVTSGTWSASFGAVSGANLTSLTAGNLTGTIPSAVLGNSSHFIGTTSIALNRASAAQSLTGVNIDGSSGSCTGNAATATTAASCSGNAATATTLQTTRTIWGQNFNGGANVTGALSSVSTITFTAEASDAASIGPTISSTQTAFDFNLADDNNNDLWRWRFTPSGSTVYNAMTLTPTANGVSNLAVAGTISGTQLSSSVATGTAPLTVTSTTVVTNLNADNLDGLTWDSAGKNVRATEFYADNWFRNYNSGEGIYNEATGLHWYSDAANRWRLLSGDTSASILFCTATNAVRGQVYADNTNSIGFLDSDGNWAIKHVVDSRTEFYVNNVEYAEINSDFLNHTSDIRTPIFYDSDNTGYYLDPASTTYLNVVGAAGRFYTGYDSGETNSVSCSNWFRSNGSSGWYNQSYGGGINMEDSTWVRVFNNKQFYSQNFIQSDASIRGPIFYDANDTGYYLDPNSTSNTALRIRGGALHGPNPTWGAYLLVGGDGRQGYIDNTATASVSTTNGNLHLDSASGYSTHINHYDGSNVYFGNGASANVAQIASDGSFRSPVFYDYDNTAYYINAAGASYINSLQTLGALTVGNSTSSDIYMTDTDETSRRIHCNSGRIGFLNSANGWSSYSDNTGNWTTDFIGYAGQSFRSPIFYDSANTGYYCDPNSTSRLEQVSPSIINNPYSGANSGITRSSYAYSFGFQETGAWSNPFPDVVFQNHTGITIAANNGYDGIRFKADYNNDTIIFQVNGGSNYLYKYYWFYTNTTGFYSDTNSWHIEPNTQTSYGSMNIRGSRNSWYGISWHEVANIPHVMFDSSGNGGMYYQTGGRWMYYHSHGNNCLAVNGSTTSASYALYVNGAIYSTANIVAYSDSRKKTNVETITNALDKVLNLRGVTYNKLDIHNNVEEKTETGVIAQEVESVFPEVVTYSEDVDEYGVSYGNFAGLFIEAIKEQQKTINILKEEIENLKLKLKE